MTRPAGETAGAAMVVASASIWPFMDAIARHLGERVGPRRWAAVAAGFAGALLVLRPGVDLFRPGALLPVVAAVGFAAVAVMNRKLAGQTPASATTLHYSIVGAVLLAPGAVLG